MLHRLCVSSVLVLALAVGGFVKPAAAQSSDKPITFVVGFAAGGVADVIARMVALKLGEHGVRIVVENRGGAGGNLAARQVSVAESDGNTVLVITTSIAINATTSRNKGYRAEDLRVVAVVASTPDVLAVHPSNPAKNLREFIAQNKDRSINFGSSGLGTTPHIGTEYLFRELAHLSVVHIPFPGGAPAVAAAIGNHVDILSASLPTAFAQIRDGSLRGIGLASRNRSASLPDIPTYGENGYPDLYSASWVAFFVPVATSDAVVTKLNAAVNEVLKDADVQQKLQTLGFDAIVTTPAQAVEFIDKEIANWARMSKAIGYSVD